MVRRSGSGRGAWMWSVAASLAACGAPASAAPGCAGLPPPQGERSTAARTIVARDLVSLRDIGLPDASSESASPLSVSPDGRYVAFVLSRADAETNGYCRALLVLPVEPGASPRIVDRGGELITLKAFARGLRVDVGFPVSVTPAWSPDGTGIAYLKREGTAAQVWIARADGSGAKAATREELDVESVAWSSDGSLLFTARRLERGAREAAEAGTRSGWLYDDRIAPNYGARPRLRESDAPLRRFRLDPATGAITPADDEAPANSAGNGAVVTRSGWRAWTSQENESLLSPSRLWAAGPGVAPIRCDAPQCLNPGAMWWDEKAGRLRFLRREGWNNETYAFYRWEPGRGSPVRTFRTTDVVQNCVPAAKRLLCTTETSTRPRRLVLLDPATGKSDLVFDPNPEFRSIRLGSVRRLRWRNDRGLEAWGDLVLPPGHRPGQKLPLVVVQYHSRGFLRGGTGDEYPVYLLAARGFAVLSLEGPPSVAMSVPGLKSAEAVNAANQRGWADRWSLLSSLRAGVRLAIEAGDVDPVRVGITGLSDGSTSVRFALINSDLFAAAAISSCCLEPKTVMTYGGIAFAKFNRAMGFPPATVEDPAFWRPMSMALNAGRMDTPLLMQLPDDEYLLALEAFQALREKEKPVEMYVFADERHIKWQPAHRLAVYERNLDWFDFWLRCREDPSAGKAAQYERWRAMRPRSGRARSICAQVSPTSSAPRLPRRPAA
jgi:dipeptidyl aminopeptidase/acylaminoacyl peptidase